MSQEAEVGIRLKKEFRGKNFWKKEFRRKKMSFVFKFLFVFCFCFILSHAHIPCPVHGTPPPPPSAQPLIDYSSGPYGPSSPPYDPSPPPSSGGLPPDGITDEPNTFQQSLSSPPNYPHLTGHNSHFTPPSTPYTSRQSFIPSNHHQIEPIAFSFPLPKAFTGPLEPNNILSEATKLFENEIQGPTSIAIYKDFLYTGTAGGAIYRGNLRTGNATRLAKIVNEACEARPWDNSVCGRPLGIRVDSQGTVFFVDAYLGLHVLEFINNQVKLTRLLGIEETGGKYMGHLVIDENAGHKGGHVLYITIASTTKDLTQWTAMVIEPDRTGIVIRYDISTGQWETIMQDLWFPTSVELTDDRTAILVAEFSSRRVLKHFIRGPLKGKTEIWTENLPGESDHLIRSGDRARETYWMPIVNARNQSNPNLLDWLSEKPWVRQELLDKYMQFGDSVEQLGQHLKNDQIERLGFSLKTGQQFYQQNIANDYGMILELDANGKIIGSLHSIDGTNSLLSEAVEGPSDNPAERVLYLGSFIYPYVLKLNVKKPIFDLPIFPVQNEQRGLGSSIQPIGGHPGGYRPVNPKQLTYDELKYVDIPSLLKSWQSIQNENNKDGKY